MSKILLAQYGGLRSRTTLSPPCAKVHMALALKGVEFDVFNCKSPGDVKRFNERGRVPALKIDDEVFVDSSDILSEIDRRWPEPALIPDGGKDRAQCRLLEDWADEVLYFQLVWLRWIYPASFQTLRESYFSRLPFPLSKLVPRLALRDVRGRLRGQGTGVKPEATIRREFRESLEMLEALLDDSAYLVGATITRADIAVVAVLDQFEVDITPAENRIDYSELPRMTAWLARVHEQIPTAAG